jgi:hypothetical protein
MSLFERIKHILFNPKDTWIELKEEPPNFKNVLTGYAIPLALIPTFFGMIGFVLWGIKLGFGNAVLRIPLYVAFIWAVIYYILTIGSLYIEGIVINALAPLFGSKQNAVNAFALAVYAHTPVFIAGVLNVIPALGILGFLLSLYSIFLLYLGLPVMMETPKQKVVGYLVVMVIVMIIVYFAVGAIAGIIFHIP